MPGPYGVVDSGFNRKRLEDIKLEMETAAKEAWGDDLNVSSSSPMGQFIGIPASQLSECWEVLEVCYHGFDPDAAEGFLLQFLASLTGTLWKDATKSVAVCTVGLNPGVELTPGKIIAHDTIPTRRFILREAVKNNTGSPGSFPATFDAETAGPVEAPANTLIDIITPVTGWTFCTNEADAIVGSPADTNDTLRARRQRELSAAGGSTPSGTVADLSKLTFLEAVSNLENDTLAVNADGVPPKSFEILVYKSGGLSTTEKNQVAQVIWNTKPSGIKPVGSTTGTAIDKNGNPQTVAFTQLEEVPIYVTLGLTTNSDYAGDPSLVKAALVTGGNTLQGGDDVIALRIRSYAFSVAGVVDVPVYNQGLSPGPVSGANLSIAVRQIARFSISNITVL